MCGCVCEKRGEMYTTHRTALRAVADPLADEVAVPGDVGAALGGEIAPLLFICILYN